MGPPIYIGGNEFDDPVHAACATGFNGATDLHRWKQEKNEPLRHFHDRFNGATDLHRWKRCWLKPSVGWGIALLQWGHRFTSVETKHTYVVWDDDVKRFNGATDLHRWKRPSRWFPAIRPQPRFNGATDLHRWKRESRLRAFRSSRSASMGPPIYIGGNLPTHPLRHFEG